MSDNIVEIKSTDVLQAINKAEIDIQIATAKQYPRDINRSLETMYQYASIDHETAEDCFYKLPRKDAQGKEKEIEGVSVRMAEIIASCWGNLRIQTRIIANDGKMITAQGICHDLETNVAVSKEVMRRITTKDGRTYSDDMQVVTGNAASAIAYRNAVLSVIPKAITHKVTMEIKKIAIGQISKNIEKSRENVISYYSSLGVSEEQLLSYLHIKSRADITSEMLLDLRSIANAVKEGSTSIEEVFGLKKDEKTVAEKKAEMKKAAPKLP